jgi:hypothetical protein
VVILAILSMTLASAEPGMNEPDNLASRGAGLTVLINRIRVARITA